MLTQHVRDAQLIHFLLTKFWQSLGCLMMELVLQGQKWSRCVVGGVLIGAVDLSTLLDFCSVCGLMAQHEQKQSCCVFGGVLIGVVDLSTLLFLLICEQVVDDESMPDMHHQL
jgi:uncharacterized protein involved in response to NO